MFGHKLKNFFKASDDLKIVSVKQPNYLNQMPREELIKLLQTTELHYFLEFSPDIAHKKIILLSYQTTNYMMPKLLGKNPGLVVNYQQETKYPPIKKNVISVKGGMNPIALKPEQFEVGYFPLATRFEESFTHYIKEMSRIIDNKGRVLISMIHPQLEWMMKNQNPNSDKRANLQITDYINLFRKENLYLENIKEVVVNEKTKPFFTASQLLSTTSKHYQEFQGMPLVVIFNLIKYKKVNVKKESTKQNSTVSFNDQNQNYLKSIYGL